MSGKQTLANDGKREQRAPRVPLCFVHVHLRVRVHARVLQMRVCQTTCERHVRLLDADKRKQQWCRDGHAILYGEKPVFII